MRQTALFFAGNLQVKKAEAAAAPAQAAAVAETFPVTGTKIYMNLGDPSLADKYASLPCDGIGSCVRNSSGRPISMNIRFIF